MEYHERPGVYSNYELSSVWASRSGSQAVAVAACYSGSGVTTVTSTSQAESLLAEAPVALDLTRLLLMNGAGRVLLYPAAEASAEGYAAAAKALLAEKTARFMICDSNEVDIQAAIRDVLVEAAEEGNECIGVVGMEGAASELVERAESLNCERMVLAAGTAVLSWDDTTAGGIYGAGAMAGLLAGQTDPALPVNGAELSGLSGVSERFTETEIDTLVKGGVTVLEAVGSAVSPIRAVTTRTTTNGASDASWREVTTIMIVDDVIPGVRDALKARFLRKKNNEATRGAIRSQVAVELENRKNREIIDSYGTITVEPDGSDPTVCVVTFSFAVTHGISRIYLTAHITV